MQLLSEIKEILGIDLDNNVIFKNPSNLITSPTLQTFNRSKRKLKEIENKSDSFSVPRNFDPGEIYDAFIEITTNRQTTLSSYFNTNTKIRKLCSSLDYWEGGRKSILKSDLFHEAIILISNQFRNSWFSILVYLLLKHWISIPPSNKKVLIQFLRTQIAYYKGKNALIVNVKDNLNYFIDDQAASSLASSILYNKWKLSELGSQLDLPTSYLQSEFFSEVAELVTDGICRQNVDDITSYLEDLNHFLEIHNNDLTIKKCYVKIIIHVSEGYGNEVIDNVKSEAFRLIGDPAIESKWYPWNNEPETKTQISKARDILNEWINREILELFFHKIIMDSDRKNFWLQYYKNANKLKIFGPPHMLNSLKLDRRISKYIGKRFGKLLQASGQCALVMEIKDYVFVEFETTGTAFYAYKKSNPNCPDFESYRLWKTDLIKPRRMRILLRRSGYTMYDDKSEGWLAHQSGWEYHLGRWINKYLGI